MVYQESEKTCGKAVVRNVLALVFRNENYLTANLSSECQDFYAMRKEMENYHLLYASYQVKDLWSIEKRKFPVIAQVKLEGKGHFVLVKKLSRKKVYLMDPQYGEYTLKKKEFQECFTGMAMLFEGKGEKVKLPSHRIVPTGYNLGYLGIALGEIIDLFCLLFLAQGKDNYVYGIIFGSILLILSLFQNLLNTSLRKKLDKEVLLPYMKAYQNPKDFSLLSKYIRDTIKRMSNTVSFLSLSMGFLMILFLNHYTLSFLALVSFLFLFLRFPLEEERRATLRYCSLEESKFLNQLKTKGSEKHFLLARKKASKLLSEIVSFYVLEAMVLLVLILFGLSLEDILTLDMFLFYFGLMSAFSVALNSLFQALYENKERLCAYNGLSHPLSSFLLKEKVELAYTKEAKKKGRKDGKTETHTGLSG